MSRSSALRDYLEDTWLVIAICAGLSIGLMVTELMLPDVVAAVDNWVLVHILGIPADETIQLPVWPSPNLDGLPPLHPTVIA